MRQGQQRLHQVLQTQEGSHIDIIEEPIEWHNDKWWRSYPVEARLQWLHIPPRIRAAAEALDLPKSDFLDGFYLGNCLHIQGVGRRAAIYAAQLLLHLVTTHQISGRWVSANDYVQMIRDSFDNDGLLGDEYSSPYVFKNIKQVFDVLVIDDLGGEYIPTRSDRSSDFAKFELRDLLVHRYNSVKTTIIISALTTLDLANRYSLDAPERLKDLLAEYEVEFIRAGQ